MDTNQFTYQHIIDITIPLSHSVISYPGDLRFEIWREKSLENGDPLNLSAIRLSVHAGTHIDAPKHFLHDGPPVGKIPIEVFLGPTRVVEIGHPTSITLDELLKKDLENVERVLFRTANTLLPLEGPFQNSFVYLEEEAALFLLEKRVKLIGIDYLSLEQFGAVENRVHKILLGKGIVILEGLNLKNVTPGDYTLVCLPLLLADAEGSPCRAVLLR